MMVCVKKWEEIVQQLCSVEKIEVFSVHFTVYSSVQSELCTEENSLECSEVSHGY